MLPNRLRAAADLMLLNHTAPSKKGYCKGNANAHCFRLLQDPESKYFRAVGFYQRDCWHDPEASKALSLKMMTAPLR